MAAIRTALIVGAGVAGPASALALAQAGIRSTIVESHAAPADGIGAIITVAANGLEVLRTLGAADAVIAEAQETSRVRMADASGHTFSEHPGAGHVLARDRLARILAELAERGGARIEYGRRFLGMDANPGGVVAHFADGGDLEADLLVGADGIHSAVRSVIDPDAPRPSYEGVIGFGAVTDGDEVSAELGVMNFAFGQRFLGYWRLPDGRICWYAALPHPELTWRETAQTPPEAWLAQLRAAYVDHSPAEQLLARTDPAELVCTGPMLRMPPLPRWHGERSVLVGDSAHAPSSSSGQGASLALESAFELARCLRDVACLDTALDQYERIRRPRVEAVAAAAAAANRTKAGAR